MSAVATASAADESGPHHEPIGVVLARVETALETIAHAIDANQAHIAAAVAAGGARPAAAAHKAMQEADLLAQKVAGIASFLRAVAVEVPGDWHVDTAGATRALTLADLALAIGAKGRAAHVHDEVDHGHCDLF
ncbi:hypothetical protein GN330_14325 [Nitratireductor sp. CAU 1489]|uniref:Uncharacterized protein n=1 Tax=Nitratireductor arenosus TaxID=2682096 RepID=A0A844QGC1_9HYPH|nr:hypothetical protein [Nitratireductor arenosus]MVA98422.1 hypothetical protein [Nitratireductor arenosus]